MAVGGPVIIIEDDKDDQEIINDLIGELGDFTTKIFSNGEEALQYLTITTDIPLLILCDINMPVMNGLELRRTVVQNEKLRLKTVPFVFFTTSANKNAVTEAYSLSVQGFFIKPSDFNKFRKTVQLILEYWIECIHLNKD